MKIPANSTVVSRVRLKNNRLSPPASADQPTRDLITLVNRELEATERLRQEVLALDGSARDQDGRQGFVSLEYYQSDALGGVFSKVVADSRTGHLRAEASNPGGGSQARVIEPGRITSSSLALQPGEVPGLSFSITTTGSSGLSTLQATFSRETMRGRATKDDLLFVLDEAPNGTSFKTASFREALQNATSHDMLRLDGEFSDEVSRAHQHCDDGVTLALVLATTSLALAFVNPLLGAGACALGAGTGYAISRRTKNRITEGYRKLANLRGLADWLTEQNELPPSWMRQTGGARK